MTPREAVEAVRDGDCIVNNAFLAVINPAELMGALAQRYRETGSPRDLTIFCAAGFGDWKSDSPCDEIVGLGGVKRVIASHFGSTPDTAKAIVEGRVEGYNLPLGVMSHMIRANASGHTSYRTQTGKNLFVDPVNGEYQLNERSKDIMVEELEIDGIRHLKYNTPNFDVAFIKATAADPDGNISFDKEAIAGDSLSLAQAVHRRGGKVIVQVESVLETRHRPWNSLIPACLVDIIVLCPDQRQIAGVDGYNPAYSGEEAMSSDEMRDYIIEREQKSGKAPDLARVRIADRAIQELSKGDIVNIGVGIPETVAVQAAKNNLIGDIVLTVESGPINGVPASGVDFGAAIGPHSIWTGAQMFDFYDGGGLNITFLGALEIDSHGNVNSHRSGSKLSGIGGFANISQNTPKVVFCATFSSGGLTVSESGGKLSIDQEGRMLKFKKDVATVSFSAQNALEQGQKVLYVTERCLFELGPGGLILREVAPGIDLQTQILDLLPFEVEVALR